MKNKLFLNSITSITNQVVVLICGFILPRLMILTYGSSVNGLVSSINQFLNVIAFMQMGVGAVVQSALYKPLSDNDNDRISAIYISAQRFFRSIACIFVIYVVILIFIYPKLTNSIFNTKFCGILILILAINMFAQYYFGLTNQMLLYADQKAYIPLLIDIFTIIGNTLITVIIMNFGVPIHIVKFVSTIIYVMRPFILTIYVRRHYSINHKISIKEEPIKQKWNGFAQHLASTVMDNTDVILLTTFSSLQNVSIYYVYNLVTFGMRQMVSSLTVGVQSLFGNYIAKMRMENVRKKFEMTELFFHFFITILFSCTLILIIPFINVYTKGIDDANYIQPLFSILIVLSQCIYCYRLVYYIMIKAAGHYKETQKSAVLEMIINLLFSIIFVIKFGLIGVMIGTVIATAYRTIYFVHYLTKYILKINLKTTIICFICDIISIISCYICCKNFKLINLDYISWIALAIKVFIISFLIVFITFLFTNIIFNNQNLKDVIKTLKNKFRRNI